jgi:hypothetical protein
MAGVCQFRAWGVACVAVFSWLGPLPVYAEGETAAPKTEGESRKGSPETLTLQGAPGGRAGSQRVADAASRPTLTIARGAQAPAIDGRLDDAIWKTAAVIDTMIQETPVEGAPATEQTEVRVAYDSEKIYFGIYAHYSNPGLVRANRSDRDKTDDDDTVTVFFEPFLDYLRGYAFSVNGYGVQRDALVVVNNAQDNPDGDTTWNALYASAGQLVADGWTAEMAIPIKSLRYPSRGAGQVHRWGFNVRRKILSKDEIVTWSPISRSVMAFIPQLGVITGMTNFSTQHNFELLPTFTATHSGAMNSTGHYASGQVEQGGVGLKYGISPELTFDFTYNPDFSQVESDTQQIDVNQRFPIQYPELRPFFLEGQEIYNIPGMPTAVHTRTIVDPKYAAKLTGKVSRRVSIGMFVANDEAPGNVDNVSDPAYKRSATDLLARVKYDLYRNSHVGMIFTDREFLNSHSRLVGNDWALRLGNTRNFGARFYMSDQQDPAGLRKTGGASEVTIRQDGRNLKWNFINNAQTPDFGTALGFIKRVNAIQSMNNVSYLWWPQKTIINWGPGVAYNRTWNFDDKVAQNKDLSGSLNFEFSGQIKISGNVHRLMERYRDIDFDKTQYGFSATINRLRKVLFTGSYNGGEEIRFINSPYVGDNGQFSAAVTFRPLSRLQSVLKVTTSKLVDPSINAPALNVKIIRSQTTYQFTSRLLIRNITELNSGLLSNHTLFQNVLVTYRVNSGTVFYVGYDDRYKAGNAFNAKIFPDSAYQRTNRAIFTKVQYLFRSGGNS